LGVRRSITGMLPRDRGTASRVNYAEFHYPKWKVSLTTPGGFVNWLHGFHSFHWTNHLLLGI